MATGRPPDKDANDFSVSDLEIIFIAASIRDRHQIGKDPPLRYHSVIHHLDEEVLFAKDVLIHSGRFHSGFEIAGAALVALFVGCIGGEQLRNVTAEAAGCGHQAFSVGLQ